MVMRLTVNRKLFFSKKKCDNGITQTDWAGAVREKKYKYAIKLMEFLNFMLFGAHVSIAGGFSNAPLNAKKIGCEVFQMFSRSPRGGKFVVTDVEVEKFKTNLKQTGITDFYIHSPYYINLASANNRIRYGSITTLREELDFGSLIGAKYAMTHLGSAKDYTEAEAIKLTGEAIDKILDDYNGSTQFLIEMSAGAGQIMGDTFEEIAKILKHTKYSDQIGICLDTCHAFASGYDFRNKKAIDETLSQLEKHLGLDKLKMFHFNDSMTPFDSHKDRHANIGEGEIGLDGFNQLVNLPKLENKNAIAETPDLKDDNPKSLQVLKSLRK
jgi:deoxyribonuclease-4